jgi:two-component system, chemotaxis family, CheB/CheR fusion protein
MAAKKTTKKLNTNKKEKQPISPDLKDTNAVKHSPEVFPIVGIGASAGGLEAYMTFLKHLPEDTDMGYVLVQHQDPTHPSALTDLLSKATRLPVIEVKDGLKVKPNHIYVMPPNTNMHMFDGTLKLNPRTAGRGLHLPIDDFFESLAEYHKAHAVGVLLSGTASDGTLGLKAIKAAGGITFAQDEKSAKYNGMPLHAIEAGVVDYVMGPDQIAKEIGRIASNPILKNQAIIDIKDPLKETIQPQDEQLHTIFRILKKSSGASFENYKPNTIIRRISRRMLLQRLETLDGYIDYLRANPKEINALYEDILINVTNFFRDPETFEVLKTEIFPKMIKPSMEKILRIWVPGCSTGEEAYSLAICLMEYMGGRDKNTQVQIFGTDISDSAIEKARAGFYSYDIQKDVNSDRLRKYFVKNDRGYQVSKVIRDLCIFAHHNVIKDPPFSKMDIISCRNLLIYFGPVLQKKVIPIFHYALNPNGNLILGSTESIGGFADYFFPADRKHRIFSKKLIPSRVHFDLAETSPYERGGQKEADPRVDGFSEKEVLKEGDRLILSKYAPPSVLINEDMNILQFRGKLGKYLEPAAGQASLNIIKMAKEGFAMELRSAVLKAKKEDRQIIVDGLQVKVNGSTAFFSLEVTPFAPIRTKERFYLITFHPEAAVDGGKKKIKQRKVSESKPVDKRQLEKLEQELSATKDYLQSIIEEQEATNEELRAANEEILSSNEELQSTNEEMETAKEELQSANEELTTVNEELHNRNVELKMINNDLNNLLASVHIPTVMVGLDFRIRRFTPMAEKVLNLISTDQGRPITDINLNINLPHLESWLQDVIDSMNHKELEVEDKRGHWYRLQIRPYKTIENKIDGAVLVLIDIDYMKRSMGDISKTKEYCEAIVESTHESFLILDGSLKIIMANRAFYRTFQVPGDVTGTNLYDLDGFWRSSELRTMLKELVPKNIKIENHKVEYNFPEMGKKTFLLNASILSMENTGEQNILLNLEDITGKS